MGNQANNISVTIRLAAHFLVLFCCVIFCREINGEETDSLTAAAYHRLATQITPVRLLTSLPKAAADSARHEAAACAALLEKYPGTDPKEIAGIIWPPEGWRILRNEFTGLITGRYCFAHVLVPSKQADEYLVVEVNFMQSARFMGFSFQETRVHSLLGVDRIKKETIEIR